MSCVVNVADFSSRAYWDRRFASESAFEWLQPSSAILPTVKTELKAQHRNDVAILHLGSGSSDLSNQLRRMVQDDIGCPTRKPLILNVDFSVTAIEIGRHREREEFGDDMNGDMRWAVVDLLDWVSFKRTYEENGNEPFDLIVEKSCTDALACGSDIPLEPSFHDASGLSAPEQSDLGNLIAPEVAFSMYVAAFTRPGGAWIALSYSAQRFDFLRDANQPAARMWSIEQTKRLTVKDDSEKENGGKIVYRPEIVHFVYTLRRKLAVI
ncbi:hypothetical protein K439DRAFT_1326399 [Ramaria rubella]|nr:hypothetical protein K439DRAFT_1326399 [Ramaria rubella]